jgi:CDP-paratose 2-epimerase
VDFEAESVLCYTRACASIRPLPGQVPSSLQPAREQNRALPQSLLVTGGAGFIGCNFVDRALSRGARVTILDDLSRAGSMKNLEWLRDRHGENVRLIHGSITDAELVRRTIADVEAVAHFAAQVAVTTSVADPRSDFDINVLGSFNVLEGARLSGNNPHVIYASTNKVYGGLGDVPTVELETRYAFESLPLGISEEAPLDFHSPYGCSKGAADQYFRDYFRMYGLPTTVFRQSCIYGPRQMGVEDQGWVAWFVIALVTGKPITIYGDGKQVRDLLYIDDLLNVFDAAYMRPDRSAGQIYNMGGGIENSISIWKEFKPIVEAALGYEVPEPEFGETRPGDQPIFVADTTKAADELGWEPGVGVWEGIAKLTDWVKANRDLFESCSTVLEPGRA